MTLTEQIKCVEREIGMRQKVYARWVDSHKMTPKQAEHEIAAMGAALKTLQYCVQLADCLDQAPRTGHSNPDYPLEGDVTITLSDTLARQISQQLRGTML